LNSHSLGQNSRQQAPGFTRWKDASKLATDRGINCVTVDDDVLRGLDSDDGRLF